jgi:hypothetical protein
MLVEKVWIESRKPDLHRKNINVAEQDNMDTQKLHSSTQKRSTELQLQVTDGSLIGTSE